MGKEGSHCFPNKLEAKEPPSDNQVGSQSDGINKGIPTVEGSAKAELIENVNNANQKLILFIMEKVRGMKVVNILLMPDSSLHLKQSQERPFI